ncbi:hypothetical protein SESBI_20212 [Sesbania bispinosa]|nr:hypothetical protein SESBI_20212 [Sesbania bispinosa]
MVYASDSMIPIEVFEPTFRSASFDEVTNDDEKQSNFDLLAEVREIAHIREYACKRCAEKKCNSNIIPRRLRARDLVLKRSVRDALTNKLTPNWDGPYRVSEEFGRGAFKLKELSGKAVSRIWNLANLRLYYS